MLHDLKQKQLVADYLADKHCISAWKNNRSMMLISTMSDHEPLFDWLFDNGWKVETHNLSTWQYYADAKISKIICLIVDDDFFHTFFFGQVEYLEQLA